MRRLLLPAAAAALLLALLGAAVSAERAHRRAAERVVRDYAGVAASELVRRAAFDIGFNGYQVLAAALRRTTAAGAPSLPDRVPAPARALVAQAWVVAPPVAIEGTLPDAALLQWALDEAPRLPREPGAFFVRRRGATTLVFVPLEDDAHRTVALEVAPAGLRSFVEHAVARGPLLPGAVGDGRVGNDVIALALRDATGREVVRVGPAPWPEWEVTVPCGDFFRGVLDGSSVAASIDPAAAERLIPGGLPPSRLPFLAALAAAAVLLAIVAVRQVQRERAFARIRDDFVASVSHELRTPLAQVRLFVETVLLGRTRSAEESDRFLRAAHRETLRLGHLVDNVLDFARAERGVLDLALVPQPLAPLVDETIQGFVPLAATRGVTLASVLDPEVAAAVDAAALRRVLLNLLDNAVKYGPEQGEVAVTLRRTGDTATLCVADQGPGVPAGEREAVFAPFHRLARDRQTVATGAGIGLAVVREIVTRHGGTCRIEDGARFVVTLPGAS